MNRIKQYSLKTSPLYGLSNKRKLENIIGLKKYSLNKVSKHITYNTFMIAKKDGEERPVTAPNPYLKRIQRSAYNLMSRIEKPDWLMSGSKGKCYIDNAKYHQKNQSKYALTLDIKKFYPNCTRKYVFAFLSDTLKMSNDVAGVLADILTYNLEIPVGSPTSQLLAFFAYEKMFNELNSLAFKHECIFTVYVDDLAFSSQKPFDNKTLINDIAFILGKYGHSMKWQKMKIYSKNEDKLFTGVILDTNNQIKVPNNLHLKITNDRKQLDSLVEMSKVEKEKFKKSFHGRIVSARAIETDMYPELIKAVKAIGA